jgi:hypothetical protein
MISKRDQINSLYNDLIYLCEVRGELDDEANARTEAKITEIMDEIQVLEYEIDQDVMEASCEFL